MTKRFMNGEGLVPVYITQDFEKIFSNKPHSTYYLNYTFRFGPILAQMAHNTISQNKTRVQKKLISFNVAKPVNLYVYETLPNREVESIRMMVQEIIKLVKKEAISPQEIWVLGRIYSQLASMEVQLLGRGVPYRLLGNDPFYKRNEIQKLLKYLRVGYHYQKPLNKTLLDDFLSILNYPNRMISKNKFKALSTSTLNQKMPLSSLKDMLKNEELLFQAGFSVEQTERLEEFLQTLEYVHQSYHSHDEKRSRLATILEGILTRIDLNSHFENYYGEGETSYERKTLVDSFRDFVSLVNMDIPTFLKYMKNLDSTRGLEESQLITLSTIHKTKGMEFDYVFIPSCIEGFYSCT